MNNTMNTTTKPASNRKQYLFFFGFVLIGGIVGFLSAILLNHLGLKNFRNFTHHLRSLLPIAAPVALLTVNVIFFILTLTSFQKSKKQIKNWDGEDETLLDTLDYKLDFPLLWTNIAMILNFALFSISEDVLLSSNKNPLYFYLSLACVICFIAGLAWICFFQRAVIELCKKMNPEKRGDFFDFNFQKQWINSCDEAQKMMIYRAGYTAFQAVSMTCIILWVITFATCICLHTGILPVLCVCIIYFVAVLSYTLSAMKAEAR